MRMRFHHITHCTETMTLMVILVFATYNEALARSLLPEIDFVLRRGYYCHSVASDGKESRNASHSFPLLVHLKLIYFPPQIKIDHIRKRTKYDITIDGCAKVQTYSMADRQSARCVMHVTDRTLNVNITLCRN